MKIRKRALMAVIDFICLPDFIRFEFFAAVQVIPLFLLFQKRSQNTVLRRREIVELDAESAVAAPGNVAGKSERL